MDTRIAMFAVLALATVFAMTAPMDYALAQPLDVMPDGEGEYDGEHEGKSCPSKEKKSTSINPIFGI